MKFDAPLKHGTLLRRYKRFLADVELESGERVTAHCPNTGGMLGCQKEGSAVVLSHRPSPKRKLDYRWELASDGGQWVGIYSAYANALVEEALAQGAIECFAEAGWSWRREVSVADSRLDFLLEHSESGRQCYVEVKSVTASTEPGVALFPDAVTQRGRRHLEALMALKAEGVDVAMLFVVQRGDCDRIRVAPEFDPDYAKTLAEAIDRGVEVMAVGCDVSPRGISVVHSLPMDVAT